MIKDVVENSIWEKAKSFIQDKYGKNIDFKSIHLSENTSSFYTKNDDLIIPLKMRSLNLGQVIVNRGSVLNSEQKNEIVDLVQFLIQPHVYHKHLQLVEENTKLAEIKSDRSDNVLTLFSCKEEKIIKLVSTVIHLRSSSELKRRKVALKIHELAEQDIFINFSEISNQLKTLEDFKGFSKTTFYVQDLHTLSVAELILLNEAVQLEDSDLVFIFGSFMSSQEINSLNISQSLKNDLNAILFDIDRIPISQQTNSDVLELLFFCVDQIERS